VILIEFSTLHISPFFPQCYSPILHIISYIRYEYDHKDIYWLQRLFAVFGPEPY